MTPTVGSWEYNITIDKPCLVVQQKGLTMWIMEDVALGLLPGPSWRREDLWQSPQLNIAQCGQASHGVACRVDTCWICAAHLSWQDGWQSRGTGEHFFAEALKSYVYQLPANGSQACMTEPYRTELPTLRLMGNSLPCEIPSACRRSKINVKVMAQNLSNFRQFSSAAPSFGQKGTLLFFKAIDDRYLWSNAEISQAVMQLPHDGKDLGIVRVLKLWQLWQLWIWTAPAPNHSLLAREFYGYSVDMGRNLVANCSESWSRDASNLLWKESCFECLADFSDWGSTILGLPAFPSSGGLPRFANTATFEISPTNHP